MSARRRGGSAKYFGENVNLGLRESKGGVDEHVRCDREKKKQAEFL